MGTFKLIGGMFQEPEETGQDTLSVTMYNCYEDRQGNTLKRPGLTTWKDMAVGGALQGLYYWNTGGFVVAICAGNAYKIDYEKNITDITTNALTNITNPAVFASDGEGLWIATGDTAKYIPSVATKMIDIADPNVPGQSTFIAYMNGYIIANSVGTPLVYFTDQTDRTSWMAIDNFSVDSIADICVGLRVYGNELYCFGSRHMEIWYNDGVSPFARIPGAVYSIGTSAPYTISEVAGGLYWLDDQRRLLRMEGRTPRPLSDNIQHTFDRISYVTDCIICDASVLGYTWLMMSFPTARRTFCYDVTMQKFYEWGHRPAGTWVELPVKFSCYVGSSIEYAITSESLEPSTVANAGVSGRDVVWTDPGNLAGGAAGSTSALFAFSATYDMTAATTSDYGTTTVSWSDEGNVLADDNTYATLALTLTTADTSNVLIAHTGTLIIPSFVTDVEVAMEVKWFAATQLKFLGFDYMKPFLYYDGAIHAVSGLVSLTGLVIPAIEETRLFSLQTVAKSIVEKADFGVGLMFGTYTPSLYSSMPVIYIDKIAPKITYNIPYTEGTGSDRLIINNFGFALTGDSISGIEFVIDCDTVVGSKKQDFEVFLTKDGSTIDGSNRSMNKSFEDGESRSYGGFNDLWGTTLTIAEVNASTFGVMFSVDSKVTEEQASISFASCTMNVYYVSSLGSFKISSKRLFGGSNSDNLYEMDHTFVTDDGTAIRVERRTGHITYKTLSMKRPRVLRIRVKRSLTNYYAPNPVMYIRWNTDGEGWTPFTEIPLDTSIQSGGIMNYTLHRLGVYKERQYEIVHEQATEFELIEMEEEVDVLNHESSSKR